MFCEHEVISAAIGNRYGIYGKMLFMTNFNSYNKGILQILGFKSFENSRAVLATFLTCRLLKIEFSI